MIAPLLRPVVLVRVGYLSVSRTALVPSQEPSRLNPPRDTRNVQPSRQETANPVLIHHTSPHPLFPAYTPDAALASRSRKDLLVGVEIEKKRSKLHRGP
jgi:hypothetical protein